MKVEINESMIKMAKSAAGKGADLIRSTISAKGHANILIVTGASQIEMLGYLTNEDIDWSVVTCFHMDEYIDMPATHNASFRKYLRTCLLDHQQRLEFQIDLIIIKTPAISSSTRCLALQQKHV